MRDWWQQTTFGEVPDESHVLVSINGAAGEQYLIAKAECLVCHQRITVSVVDDRRVSAANYTRHASKHAISFEDPAGANNNTKIVIEKKKQPLLTNFFGRAKRPASALTSTNQCTSGIEVEDPIENMIQEYTEENAGARKHYKLSTEVRDVIIQDLTDGFSEDGSGSDEFVVINESEDCEDDVIIEDFIVSSSESYALEDGNRAFVQRLSASSTINHQSEPDKDFPKNL